MKQSYNFAPKEELELIHTHSLKLLRETGVVFYCDEALEVFKKHGARIDGKTVFIEEKMLNEALKTIPQNYEWHGRKGTLTLGGTEPIYASSYGPMYVYEDDAYHFPTPLDFANFAKLDQSSKVVTIGNPNNMDMPQIKPENRSNYAMAATLMYLDKPLMGMVDGKKVPLTASIWFVSFTEQTIPTNAVSYPDLLMWPLLSTILKRCVKV